MIQLGYCAPDVSNLTNTGLASGRATWTPDEAGGGVLTVTIPAGAGCGGEFLGTSLWASLLELRRSGCGKKLHIAVAGTASTYAPTDGGVIVYSSEAIVMAMEGPGGDSFCGAAAMNVITGSNPCDVPTKCSDGSEGYYTAMIILSGYNLNAAETSITVTVTLI